MQQARLMATLHGVPVVIKWFWLWPFVTHRYLVAFEFPDGKMAIEWNDEFDEPCLVGG